MAQPPNPQQQPASIDALSMKDNVPKRHTEYCRPGDMINNRFKIVLKIGEGGYGEVYKAVDVGTNKEVAVKVEEIDEDRPNMEPSVIAKFQGNKCCPTVYARGIILDDCSFIVMQLLGKNLSWLQKQCPSTRPPRLSLATAFRCAVQCIQAIETLHAIGYLHRDVNPTNFAVGNEPASAGTIYLLDYGLCRYFLNADGLSKKARTCKVGFRGTAKYASLSAHEGKDLSRVDDAWSLFYTIFELTVGQLPWKDIVELPAVYAAKKAASPESMCPKTLPELSEFVQLVRKLGFPDKPAYKEMTECFDRALKRIGAKPEDQIEWLLKDGCKGLQHFAS